MTADVFNLRLARKRKARGEREAAAQENRARHGLPKGVRDKRDRQRGLETRRLEEHKRKDEPPA